jgi:hypothetical protein
LKKLSSESDFEQSVRKKGEKIKKKKGVSMEISRKLRDRKRNKNASGVSPKDSDAEDYR